MEIVHITLEKLTGLKGEISGHFLCNSFNVDTRLPVVFIGDVGAYDCTSVHLNFRQGNNYFSLKTIPEWDIENYHEHFQYGVNFLIKEWSYGNRVATNSQDPN